MLIGVLLGLVLIVVVIAIVLLSHYCSVTSIEHLQEICRTVAALREAAMAFPGRVENNDWWEGDNPSQLKWPTRCLLPALGRCTLFPSV